MSPANATRFAFSSNRSARSRKAEQDYAATIVQYLANRSCHIPGNKWSEDYVQYFANNHPLFGMCCHHRLHPVRFRQRFFILVGSIAFGLAITNVIVLYFVYYSDDGFDTKVFAANITLGLEGNSSVDEFSVTNGQIFLWTVGSGLHSFFDLATWYIAASACCQPGGRLQRLGSCKMLGSYLVIFITVIAIAVATFLVILRATIINDPGHNATNGVGTAGVADDEILYGDINGIEDFRFLISFLIEVALALFIWYFVTGTILFSGILGCGRVPLLGGRPVELRAEEKAKLRELRAARDIESG